MRTEERKKYENEYYLKNREKILERQKQYNFTRKIAQHEYSKKYRESHKEKLAEQKKQYYLNNKEEYQKRSKKYSDTHKETIKIRSRKHTIKQYGITEEQFVELLYKQDGNCAICGRHQDVLKTSLHIDHCHTTGKIRGLLCFKCNTLLGNVGDNVVILESAINYLKNNH